MNRRLGQRARQQHTLGFGWVSTRERRQADLFFSELMGAPRPAPWNEVALPGESFAEDAAEDRARADLRDTAIERARTGETFLSRQEVTRAIDGRASHPTLQPLFDSVVTTVVPIRRTVDASGGLAPVPLTLYWGLIVNGAQRLTDLLERERFQCSSASGSTLVVHGDVVDGMRATWSRSGESLRLGELCRTTSPTLCPTSHAGLHAPGTGTGSDAAHFVGLDSGQARVVELTGLFGLTLRGVRAASRPSTAVQQLPTSAPLQTLSFVAVRQGTRRAIHVARETPRKVEAWIDGDQWLCLPFVPGLSYRLFKRRMWEASFHRQWGKKSSIDWIAGLANFYQDQTGLPLGVGDISHVLGEVMTDHGSHRVGKDVDLYVLEAPPTGSTFPVAFWCSGTSASLELRELGAPSATATRPEYSVPASSTAAIATPRHTTLMDRYATILAYCVATQGAVNAAVWHGAPALSAQAVTLAQAAWDATVAAGAGTAASPGWRASWGTGPATRAALVAPPAGTFIGAGSSSYGAGRGWPPHQDHVHVRLR